MTQLALELDPEPSPLDDLIARMVAVLADPPAFGSPVGCSRATGKKHPIYLGLMQWLVTMFGPLIRAGSQFCLFETHAGPAWYRNSTTGQLTVGTPLIDLDVLDRHPLFASTPYRAVFCERGRPRRIVEQLRNAIELGGFGTHGQVDVLHGDFEDVLPTYLWDLRGRICGVLFADANGSISHDLVALFQSPRLRNVDLVLWHQARVRTRFGGLTESSTAPGAKWYPHTLKYDYRPLRDLLPDFGKAAWLIRRPFNAGSNTAWTMLVGSNKPDLRPWPSNEFYRLDSLEGQAILAECDACRR